MINKDHAFKTIDGYREEIINFQTELTAIPALSPDNGGSGEHEKSEYIKGKLEELQPTKLQEIKSPDERAKDGYRPNIVATWEKDSTKPFAWVLSHMDIVPPGDLSLWDSDPYEVKVDGDNIIGRGVEDNQHGIVASYLALKAVIESDCQVNNVGLVMVADEENGSKYGLDYVLKNHRELFSKDDLIIVPDWGAEDGSLIEVAEKSMLWVKFSVKGLQCHASTPERGNNSLYGTAKLILELETLKKKFDLSDNLFSPPLSTFEPTKIEANVPNVNTIPGKDTFYMDCRILPAYETDEVLESIKELTHKIEDELSLTIDMGIVNREDASNPTSVDAPVVKALKKAIKEVKGIDAATMGIGGGTVASFFRRAGFPAAVWGTCLDVAHQPNEYCRIKDLIEDIKILASIYMDENLE
ncbi:M20 family metallo-hydrolase [Thermodesulfobacteriota bacterium]